jgi:DNA repair exonuclease SbcCD ATPase subunit
MGGLDESIRRLEQDVKNAEERLTSLKSESENQLERFSTKLRELTQGHNDQLDVYEKRFQVRVSGIEEDLKKKLTEEFKSKYLNIVLSAVAAVVLIASVGMYKALSDVGAAGRQVQEATGKVNESVINLQKDIISAHSKIDQATTLINDASDKLTKKDAELTKALEEVASLRKQLDVTSAEYQKRLSRLTPIASSPSTH